MQYIFFLFTFYINMVHLMVILKQVDEKEI